MAAEEKPATRGTTATVVATAAVTLAIGVTAAALGGYLSPRKDARTEAQVATSRVATEAPPAPESPAVVLVPVSQEPPLPRSMPAAEPVLAAHGRDDGRDDPGLGDGEDDDHHHRGRAHDDDEDERDHDD